MVGVKKVANRRVWDASGESVRAELLRTHEEDTAVRAVSPPLMYLRRFIPTHLTRYIGGGVLFPAISDLQNGAKALREAMEIKV